MLQVLAPVKTIGEVEKFVTAGIKQFYGGVVFEGLGRTNARPQGTAANFKDLNELKIAIDLIHKNSGHFSLTLNTTSFNISNFNEIYELLEPIGVDAFIISDFLLLEYLNTQKIKQTIHVSTLTGITNSEGFDFFKKNFPNLNFNRFCLERAISKEMLLNVVKNYKYKQLEFFIYNGRCTFIEGGCNIGEYLQYGNKIKEKREGSCEIDGCKFLKAENNIQVAHHGKACGLCTIQDLPYNSDMDIILKIAGRADQVEYNINVILKIQKAVGSFSEDHHYTIADMKQIYKEINGKSCSIKNCMYK